MNGCRILGVYTENYQVGHYQVTDLILLDALLDEAEYYIRGLVNTQMVNSNSIIYGLTLVILIHKI